MQCCLKHLRQHCIELWPVQCCPQSNKTTLNRMFSYAILSWSISDNITLGFEPCNVVARVLRRDWTGAFLIQCCLEHLGHCVGFCLVQCCPKSIKTTFNRIFVMQWCLKHLGQHCIGFWPVQCCPKSINTTLNRIFSYAILSWGISDNIAWSFDLLNVVLRVLR